MVLVVGGFGRNAYLYRKIEEYCKERGIGTRTPQFPYVLDLHISTSLSLTISPDGPQLPEGLSAEGWKALKAA